MSSPRWAEAELLRLLRESPTPRNARQLARERGVSVKTTQAQLRSMALRARVVIVELATCGPLGKMQRYTTPEKAPAWRARLLEPYAGYLGEEGDQP